jgi:hypothetical protein
MEQWWNDTDRIKPNYSYKNSSNATVSTKNLKWTPSEWIRNVRDKQRATKGLIQGMDLKPDVRQRDMQKFNSRLAVITQNSQSEKPVLLMLCV